MGCDFTWNGSIEDPAAQVEAVGLYRACFDPACFWTEIRPEPATTVRALFGSLSGLDPDSVEAKPERVVEDYPLAFYGAAPYLDPSQPSKRAHRGELVFDRSDGGRIVSIVDGRGDDGRAVTVCPGGYLRLVGDAQCYALALFLVVLRERLCPGLEASDDCGYIRQIEGWLRESDGLGETRADDLDPESLLSRMVLALGPPGVPDDDVDEDPVLDRMMRFDFLPSNTQKSAIFGLPPDDAGRRRIALETLAALCRRAPKPPGPEAPPTKLLIGLCSALNHAWRSDVKPGVAMIQNSMDGESIEVVLGDGRGVVGIVLPRGEVRAMLRRVFGG